MVHDTSFCAVVMQGNHPLAPIARINHAGALCGTQALLGGQAAAGENRSKEAGGDFRGNSGGNHYSLAGPNLNAFRFLHLNAAVPFMERHIRNRGPKVETGVADMGASRHLDGICQTLDFHGNFHIYFYLTFTDFNFLQNSGGVSLAEYRDCPQILSKAQGVT